jgi:hypothetical protein
LTKIIIKAGAYISDVDKWPSNLKIFQSLSVFGHAGLVGFDGNENNARDNVEEIVICTSECDDYLTEYLPKDKCFPKLRKLKLIERHDSDNVYCKLEPLNFPVLERFYMPRFTYDPKDNSAYLDKIKNIGIRQSNDLGIHQKVKFRKKRKMK